jgi:hypothetical protein
MTPALTHLVAREHINDLLREADRSRRAAQVAASRRLRLPLPHLLARLRPRPATA